MFKLRNGLFIDASVQSIVDFYADAIVIPTSTVLDWQSDLTTMIGRRSGRSMFQKARSMAPIELGEALATTGGGLLSTFVIHAAIFPATEAGSGTQRADVLRSAVRNVLLRCGELGIENVGVPNLGGYLGLAVRDSARTMLDAAASETPKAKGLREMHFVLDNEAELKAFNEAAEAFST